MIKELVEFRITLMVVFMKEISKMGNVKGRKI